MIERAPERKLPLPETKLLSPEPQVEIIGITTSLPDKNLEAKLTGTLSQLEVAIRQQKWSDVENLFEGYQALIAQRNQLQEVGSSLTLLAGEAARTCYSREGIYTPKDYLDPKHHPSVTDSVITSTRESGHLTTRQHTSIVFGLNRVSRAFLWTFPHAHPFYNSEQVSQRYVEMKPGNFTIPPLEGETLTIYEQTAQMQMEAYQTLLEILRPTVAEEYYRIFPARRKLEGKKTREANLFEQKIASSTQEIARYVLPIATHAYLYHTVNALTLMRYYRTCQLYDVPLEQRIVVTKLVNEVLKVDPRFLEELKDPFPLEKTPEHWALTHLRAQVDPEEAEKFTQEFDRGLGGWTSKLVGSFGKETVTILARAVREVLGVSQEKLSDEEAINLLLNPAQNQTLGDPLNLTTVTKVNRVMELVSYTFAKKISHTADSQDQRHRMTPAARPVLATHYSGKPDYITPPLISQNPEASRIYHKTMEKTFAAVNQLLKRGVPAEYALYLLPNAFPIRFTGTGTLLNLRHKDAMRLCFNAQEEIWKATRDEVRQIKQIHPLIGQYLLPPCTTRKLAADKPLCPEGGRFCGVNAWNLPVEGYKRLI